MIQIYKNAPSTNGYISVWRIGYVSLKSDERTKTARLVQAHCQEYDRFEQAHRALWLL